MKTYAQIKPIPIENTIPGEEVIYKWLASRYTQIISLGTIYLFVLGFLYRSYRHAFFGIPNDSGESFADVAIFAVNVIVYFERSVSEAALKHIPAFVAILICAGFAAYGIQRWQQFFFGWASKVPETLWVALLMLMAVELSADIAKVAAKESAKLYRGIALDIAKGYPHREHPTLIIETTRTYAIAHASFWLDRLALNVFVTSQLLESDVDFVACDTPYANRLTIQILAAMAEHESRIILRIVNRRGHRTMSVESAGFDLRSRQ